MRNSGVAMYSREQISTEQCRGVCRWAKRVFEKLNFSFLKRMTSNFSEIGLGHLHTARSSQHTSTTCRIGSFILKHCNEVRAVGAYRERAVYRWPTLISEKLEFNFSQKVQRQFLRKWSRPPAQKILPTSHARCMPHGLRHLPRTVMRGAPCMLSESAPCAGGQRENRTIELRFF